jgi:tRNA pseudouridine32 synthase/23S rRNA pseudouridine746 synthase
MIASHILFEDAEAIVIDKPAGLPVDPPRNGGPSVVGLADQLRLGFQREPVPAHRLDRDTSGCLLLARHAKALKRFQASFAERLVEKQYFAIVAGVPEGVSGAVDLALSKVSTREAGWRMIPARKGQAAQTDWSLLAVQQGMSLIRLTPHTGRTHQLRVHMASGLGRAIVGDSVYGHSHPAGLMLHASRLIIPRIGKEAIRIHAPFPERFAALGFADPDA